MPYKNKVCGIYCIENLVNHKKYIGQSCDILSRWCGHKMKLRNNNHVNVHLQSSWNMHGEESFSFYILEECDKTVINQKEKYWIQKFDTTNQENGFNMTDGGEHDYVLSPEAIEKIKQRVYHVSEATRERISKSQIGKTHSEEWKARMSQHHKAAIANGEMVVNTSGLLLYNNTQKKKVACMDSNGVVIRTFESVQDAGRKLNLPATNICKVLKGKYKHCGGYSFRYDE